MTYPDAGRYFCVSSPGLFPDLIQLATHSRFSHTGMFGEHGDVIEAMPGGVRRAHITEYAGRRIVVNTDPMTSAQQTALVTAAEAMVGVPYNDLAIIDDGLECLGAFWAWLADHANRDHETMCSQAVALTGLAAGYDWMCGKARASEVTPANLARRPGMTPYQVRL